MSESAKIVLDVDDTDAAKVDAANDKLNALGASANKADGKIVALGEKRVALEGLERSGKMAGKAVADIGGALQIAGGNDIGGGIGDIAESLERAAGAANGVKLGLGGTVTILAAVGASAFAIGKAIGDIVFQTEYWNKQLAIAGQNSDRLTAKNLARLSRDFSQFMALEGLEETPQVGDRLKRIQTEIVGVQNNLRAAERERDRIAAAWWPGTGEAENADRAVRDAQQMLDLLESQRMAVEDLAGFQQTLKQAQADAAAGQRERDTVQALKEQLELLQATNDERTAILAARQAASIDGQAEIELLTRALAITEKQLTAEKAIARERQQLSYMRQELTSGKDAAAAMRAELELIAEGVDKAEARRLVRERQRLQKDLEQKAAREKESQRETPSLAAVESRLLTSGRAADPNKSLLDELKGIKAATERQQAALAKTADAWYELAKRNIIYGAPGTE